MNPASHSRRAHVPASKSGQTLIFLALVVVMIAFCGLFYFDVHKVLHIKGISRNAGDAAALAGARWQAISLNLIGNLNVAQAVAITDSIAAGETASPEAELIADLQGRLKFSGPLFGFMAAQQVAKNNGMHNNEEFENFYRTHAANVAADYLSDYPEEPFTPLPEFGNAWLEYADTLDLIADHGIAVDAENFRYFANYVDSSHILLNPSFYDAVAAPNWCWFYHNAYSVLLGYSNHTYWDPLPEIVEDPPENSEVFSLQLSSVSFLDSIPVPSGAATWAELLENFTDESVDPAIATFEADFAYYGGAQWGSWSSRIPSGFPWDESIRAEYDYSGADAAVRTLADNYRHTGFSGGEYVNWTAAAKPFGSIDGGVPNRFGVVLPAFTDVRLIPVDLASGTSGATRAGWRTFIMSELPRYIEFGPSVLRANNYYSQMLLRWENLEFRQAGVAWLEDNANICNQPPPRGGGGSQGGSFRGH